ncbi:MAG: hypothetical protein Ct9H300mP23_08760 [Nitrospinota bacterium]|nr:MAG: hypothetical protein Ct9H300mP23_08760 [Nitrospinota bacterium]
MLVIEQHKDSGQTIANLNLPMQHDLAVVPVINKIDPPSANPDFIKEQLEDVLQIESDNAVLVSAKEGIGFDELMESITNLIPPPKAMNMEHCKPYYSMPGTILFAVSLS